uniref:Ig-like domain-containing protein n=1 Tax=Cynoglossus semilaevis TaxID=244447 RepID=A0A3P8X6Q5_CYNSE
MLQVILFIELLLVHSTTQSLEEREANCNDDVELKCPHPDIANFDSVVWYKHHDNKIIGIVVKTVKSGKVSRYDSNSKGTFGDNYSLLLSRVTPDDATIYMCKLNAKLGFQNKEVEVKLTVNECVTAWTPVLNSSQPMSRHPTYTEIPLVWSLVSYAAVGILKFTISIICVLIVHHQTSRKLKLRC